LNCFIRSRAHPDVADPVIPSSSSEPCLWE
jgi:hypothetical protein